MLHFETSLDALSLQSEVISSIKIFSLEGHDFFYTWIRAFFEEINRGEKINQGFLGIRGTGCSTRTKTGAGAPRI